MLLSLKHFKLYSGFKLKLAPRYVGPFKILEDIGPNHLAYRIQLPEHLRMHNVFHVSALRPYHSDGNYQPPPLPELIDDELEYAVDWIEATRLDGRMRKYLVHWEGYADPTWEPIDCLTNCDDKLREFWRFRGQNVPASE